MFGRRAALARLDLNFEGWREAGFPGAMSIREYDTSSEKRLRVRAKRAGSLAVTVCADEVEEPIPLTGRDLGRGLVLRGFLLIEKAILETTSVRMEGALGTVPVPGWGYDFMHNDAVLTTEAEILRPLNTGFVVVDEERASIYVPGSFYAEPLPPEGLQGLLRQQISIVNTALTEVLQHIPPAEAQPIVR